MKTRAAVPRCRGAAVPRKAGTPPAPAAPARTSCRARYAGAKHGPAAGSPARKYTLDEINDGYRDLMDGKNIRGVVVHSH
jgi:hypothetical protein